jgi:hypothetical protein
MFEGLVAGLLAYVAVALVFAAADLLLGRPLFATPAIIGNLLFFGGREAAPVVSAGPVAAANGVHLLLAVGLGLVAALLVEETERHPQFFYVTFLVVVLFLFASTAVLLGIPSAVRKAAPWVVTLIANAAGLAVAGLYLWRAHPRLRSRLDELSGGEETPEAAAR